MTPALAARIHLRRVLIRAVALGVDADRKYSVAACAARKLLRDGSDNLSAIDTWSEILAMWVSEREEGHNVSA